jgi:Na+/H+ antiporter NhaD/arsenite permease-like protein
MPLLEVANLKPATRIFSKKFVTSFQYPPSDATNYETKFKSYKIQLMEGNILIMIIVVQVLFWGTLFGIVYIFISARNKERMALINKGADASIFRIGGKKSNRLEALKWGLVIVSLGIGVFVGGIMMETRIIDEGPAFISMPLIFGGGGLLAYYGLTRNLDDDENNN